MKHISIKLAQGLGAVREQEILSEINTTLQKLSSTFNLEALFPNSSDETRRLMHAAKIDDQADAQIISTAISQIQGIQFAQAAPQRS